MKALNFIDLAFQTLILGAVSLLSLAMLFARSLESISMIAMYGALFLGPWQLVSSIMTVISKGLYIRWRVIHLVSALVYLAGISLSAAFLANVNIGGVLKIVLGVFGFGIPTVLAVFYYFITVKSFQLSRAQTKAT